MSKTYALIALLFTITIYQSAMAQTNERIHHTVFFKLKWASGSKEEQEFLVAAKKLALLQGVEKFECLKQVSKNNKFEFGLSMEFANQKLYDAYILHPDHSSFVQNKWLKEVIDFMEIDYLVLN